MQTRKVICGAQVRIVVLATTVIVGLSVTLQTVQERAPIPSIEEIAPNLYLLAASNPEDRVTWTGGNTVAFVVEQGVVLVDTKLPGYGSDIIAQVANVTDKPITTIINTHTHFDHSGSNTEFPDPVEVVSHEKTRANMARETCQPVTNCDAFKGGNARYLPRRTFTERMSLFGGEDQIDLFHFGPGHTDGDTFVVFRQARMMHTGDMFQRRNVPFIDFVNSGGSATEFAVTLQKAVDGISGVDTIIPGHSNTVLPWSDFTAYTDFMTDILTMAQEGKRSGASVDEVVEKFSATAYPRFEINSQRVKDNIQAIYDNR